MEYRKQQSNGTNLNPDARFQTLHYLSLHDVCHLSADLPKYCVDRFTSKTSDTTVSRLNIEWILKTYARMVSLFGTSGVLLYLPAFGLPGSNLIPTTSGRQS